LSSFLSAGAAVVAGPPAGAPHPSIIK